jgi:TonB family protein
MNNFIEYTLKASFSLTVFYLFYWLVLRRDTHFYMNRAVLLFSVVVSMVLPTISMHSFTTLSVMEKLPTFHINFSPDRSFLSPVRTVAPEAPINYWKILTIVYLTGIILVFARLVYQAIFLHAISRLSEKIEYDGYTIICMNTDIIPFSYFNRIFIPSTRIDENSFGSIVAHEKSHLNQGHYVDLFIVEILTVLQWFNPVVWFYEKSIREVHEYLADEAVINSGSNQGKYLALLVNQALGGPVFILTNQFNQSLIKKRIIMMKKMKTSRMAKLKALLIIPLIAGLLLAFANPQTRSFSTTGGPQSVINGNISDRSTGKALQGGIVLIKGTNSGTITDKEGNYSINVSDNTAILVYSLVGYRTQEIPVASNTKINVQMEQDIYIVDFSTGNNLNTGVNPPDSKDQGKSPSDEKEKLYVVTEEPPSYPGGTDALRKYLMENLQYPADAKKKGIEGKVIVNFIINAKGLISDAKIMRGVSSDLDLEALRLVNSMKGWKPASHNGEPLSMAVTMPIEFKIN